MAIYVDRHVKFELIIMINFRAQTCFISIYLACVGKGM